MRNGICGSYLPLEVSCPKCCQKLEIYWLSILFIKLETWPLTPVTTPQSMLNPSNRPKTELCHTNFASLKKRPSLAFQILDDVAIWLF